MMRSIGPKAPHQNPPYLFFNSAARNIWKLKNSIWKMTLKNGARSCLLSDRVDEQQEHDRVWEHMIWLKDRWPRWEEAKQLMNLRWNQYLDLISCVSILKTLQMSSNEIFIRFYFSTRVDGSTAVHAHNQSALVSYVLTSGLYNLQLDHLSCYKKQAIHTYVQGSNSKSRKRANRSMWHWLATVQLNPCNCVWIF